MGLTRNAKHHKPSNMIYYEGYISNDFPKRRVVVEWGCINYVIFHDANLCLIDKQFNKGKRMILAISVRNEIMEVIMLLSSLYIRLFGRLQGSPI